MPVIGILTSFLSMLVQYPREGAFVQLGRINIPNLIMMMMILYTRAAAQHSRGGALVQLGRVSTPNAMMMNLCQRRI